MSQLEVAGLAKAFGSARALDGIDLAVAPGEFFCLVGPTNAGKSTLLKCIAGPVRQDAGRIAVAGRDVTAAEPRDRHVSLLFQNIALFPTLTGFENIAFPLRTAGVVEEQLRRRVAEVAETLSVTHLLDRLPRTFSGGEQQRVAIGRAIARPAELLLLDEPLTNLDARIRIQLRLAFKRLHAESGRTLVYVTHDQVEAMSLSDRIGVLHEGRLQQVGTPDEVYHRPASRFVAEFVGSPPMNLLPAELVAEAGEPLLRGDGFRLPGAALRRMEGFARLPQRLAVGVRPERVVVAAAAGPETPFAGEVLWIENLGAKAVLVGRLGGQPLRAVVPAGHPVRREGPAWFGFPLDPLQLLNPADDRFLR